MVHLLFLLLFAGRVSNPHCNLHTQFKRVISETLIPLMKCQCFQMLGFTLWVLFKLTQQSIMPGLKCIWSRLYSCGLCPVRNYQQLWALGVVLASNNLSSYTQKRALCYLKRGKGDYFEHSCINYMRWWHLVILNWTFLPCSRPWPQNQGQSSQSTIDLLSSSNLGNTRPLMW